jgi:hypothetical protein
MNAEANPYKINNQINQNISSSTVTLGRLLKQLKNQSKGDGQSSSSKLSTNIDSNKLQKFKDLYSKLEAGELTNEKFKNEVTEEIKVSPQFDRILNDPHRSYREIVKTLDISKKKGDSELYDTKKTGTVISSTALTTVNVPSKSAINLEELNSKIKSYAQGFSQKSDFLAYLQEKKVPITTELERNIREHEETKSVPFYKLGKCVYTSISENDKTNSLIGSPNKKNPNSFRFVNRPNLGKGDPVTKEKMKEECLQKELDKLGNGVYFTHKKRMEPKIVNNGELTVWEPDYSESKSSKTLSHLQHHDIFGWDNIKDDTTVVRKAKITQRAAMTSGDIIKWQD